MTTSYPGALDALTNPTSSDPLTSPSHASQHANANDAVEAIETRLGITGSFTNPYITDLWIAGPVRTNPTVNAQSIYSQLRISGNAGAVVHDGLAAEIRLTGISNATYFNAIESSVVITGGINTIPDARAITVNLHFEGVPTGVINAVKLIGVQTIAAPPAGMSIERVYGLWVEAQNVGTIANYSVYAPTGNSLFGTVIVDMPQAAPADVFFRAGGSLRWIVRRNSTAESGANAGSDLEIIARSDTGGNVGVALTITRSNIAIKFGTGPLGFYGTAPVAKPTGVAVTAAGIHAALVSLGLIAA